MSTVSVEERNLYELLGVDRGATTEQIREVYHEIARVYHPDSHFYDEIAAVELSPDQLHMFKIITAAYNTLTDAERRLEYDQKLTQMASLAKLRDWEEGNDEFFSATAEKYHKGTVSFRTRKMTGTFGRAEILSEILEQEEEESAEDPISIKESVARFSRVKLILVASLLSGCLFGGMLFYMIFLRHA